MKKLILLPLLYVTFITNPTKLLSQNKQEKAEDLAKSIVERKYCEYDCKITEVYTAKGWQYGDCFTVVVKGQFSNQYGGYKNEVYLVVYDKDGFKKTTTAPPTSSNKNFLNNEEYDKFYISGQTILGSPLNCGQKKKYQKKTSKKYQTDKEMMMEYYKKNQLKKK